MRQQEGGREGGRSYCDSSLSLVVLLRMEEAVPNATATAKVPSSFFQPPSKPENKATPTERISYGVFFANSLFTTPETNCSESAIASLVLSVRANHSSVNLAEGIALSFQQLQNVSII